MRTTSSKRSTRVARRIWLRGALHELPDRACARNTHFIRTVKDHPGLSCAARLDARRDERAADVRMNIGDDATIGDIVRTKLGRELCYQFVEPMVGGIQAGRIDDLSAKSVFPALFAAATGWCIVRCAKWSRRAGSDVRPEPRPDVFSLTDGVGSLPFELARLRSRGVVVRTGSRSPPLRRTPSGSYPWEIDIARPRPTPADAVVLADAGAATARASSGTVDRSPRALRRFERRRGDGHLQCRAPRAHAPRAAVPASSCRWVRPGPGEGSMMATAVTFLDRKWPHLHATIDVLLRAHVGTHRRPALE